MADLKYNDNLTDKSGARVVLELSCPKDAVLDYAVAQTLKASAGAKNGNPALMPFTYASENGLTFMYLHKDAAPLERFLRTVITEDQFLGILCDLRDVAAFCEGQGASLERVELNPRYVYRGAHATMFAFVPANVRPGGDALGFLRQLAADAKFAAPSTAAEQLTDWVNRQHAFQLVEFSALLRQYAADPHSSLVNNRLAGASFAQAMEAEDRADFLSVDSALLTTGATGSAGVNARMRAATPLDEVLDTDFEKQSALAALQASRLSAAVAAQTAPRVYTLVAQDGTCIPLPQEGTLAMGRASANDAVVASQQVSSKHAQVAVTDGVVTVTDLGSTNGTTIDGKPLAPRVATVLIPGAVLRLAGEAFTLQVEELSAEAAQAAAEAAEPEYFYPAPRLVREVKSRAFAVDGPPAAQKKDETSLAMRIVPSLVMVFASLCSVAVMATMMLGNGGSMLRAIPMGVMALAMLVSAVVWPAVQRHLNNKKIEADEARRKERYSAYIDRLRHELADETRSQRAILTENRIGVSECLRRLEARADNLMDRTPKHADFCMVRAGVGTEPLAADVSWPQTRFAVERDPLEEMVAAVAAEPLEVRDVPVALDLRENRILGIVGENEATRAFLRGLVVELCATHTYEDVKLMLFAGAEAEDWNWIEGLPHIFDDLRETRFCATDSREAAQLSGMLARLATARAEATRQSRAAVPQPRYVVVVPVAVDATRAGVLADVCETIAAADLGITVVCLAERASDLPKQTRAIIALDAGVLDALPALRHATLTATSAAAEVRDFIPDVFLDADGARLAAAALADVRLDVAGAALALPKSLSFMDALRASSMEDLNLPARWAANDASRTLACVIGTGEDGEPFVLDLHERVHGPHGLIAGTTGSGKSEFIITWILSMAATYSPEEVAFLLIDYKGGGLASAFENDARRLPHLAGTITNLDGAGIARSLVSITAELKRRQALMNEARAAAGGDNVDIYSYIRMRRAGVTLPDGTPLPACPHLFIVADEFAELKDQQPEFMDALVSAARIGRSLGVHLILATQKPDGVVSQQIWSNAKFKVCLKVADAADSKAMIQRPDAANLTEAGRFYMLVGYNEGFYAGQAAYAGAVYVPTENGWQPPRNAAVAVVDGTGRALSKATPATHAKAVAAAAATGAPARRASQLVAAIDGVQAAAGAAGLQAEPLWLPELPARVTVAEVREAFAEVLAANAEPGKLAPVVGLVDDPAKRAQYPLTLPLTEGGNAVIYGAPGSGTEEMMAGLVYDLITTHTAKDLNIYILDFASETLGVFDAAPQVGDVITISQTEKLENLFTMLDAELKSRRKVLAAYSSLAAYNAENPALPLPSILLLVDGMERFAELGDAYQTRFAEICRDGMRVGLHVVVSATRATGLSFRLSSLFKMKLALQQNTKDEYTSIFGMVHDVALPDARMTGLVKAGERLLRFRAASVAEPEDAYRVIVAAAEVAAAAPDAEAANAVPVLPEVVRADDLATFAIWEGVPVGISRASIMPVFHNFSRVPTMLVLSDDDQQATMAVQGLLPVLRAIPGKRVVMLDPDGLADAAAARGAEAPEAYVARVLAEAAVDDTLLVMPSLWAVLGVKGAGAEALKAYIKDFDGSRGRGLVVTDALWRIQPQAFDAWCKALMFGATGIWVGDNVTSQAMLKVGRQTAEMRGPLESGFGWYISNGRAEMIKTPRDLGKEE